MLIGHILEQDKLPVIGDCANSNPLCVCVVFFNGRVDGKDMISVPQRRLSFDCKTSKSVFSQQSDVISHNSSRDDMEKVRQIINLCEFLP